MHREADGARLVGDGSGDGLPDPPGGVGGELEAAAVVELLDGAHEADVAFLNQVKERHAGPGIVLGDRDDEAQVGLDELALGRHIAALDALGQRDLLLGREQRDLAHLLEVHAHGVVGGALHREVERGSDLRLDRLLLHRRGLPAVGAERLIAVDHVDAEVAQED